MQEQRTTVPVAVPQSQMTEGRFRGSATLSAHSVEGRLGCGKPAGGADGKAVQA